jgi:tetratricopeptide (TPR) repeat protein
VLSVLFYYAAFAVFLYSNRETMSFLRALAIVASFGAAAATKEHTLTLPILLLLTDFYWRRGGFKKNGVLYGLLALAGLAGGVVVWRIVTASSSAGFSLRDLSPTTYFFTQCRVVWTYVRMFFLPYGQNVDPDVHVSAGLTDVAAIAGLVAWVAIAIAAWIYRKRFPLASFGVLVFLLLIAPTSSIVPIRDVLAERRVYLPFLGLILICLEGLRRVPMTQSVTVGAVALLACTVLTYRRSAVWGSPLELWEDSVAKSPNKVRPRFHLAFAQYQAGNCQQAAATYEIAATIEPPEYRLLVDWANALDCANREDEAAAKLRQAIPMFWRPSEAYVLLGAIYGKQRRLDEALQALDQAEKIDAGLPQIYLNRGGVYTLLGNKDAAIQSYRRALQIDPTNRVAQDALTRLSR